jgi:UDP-N-acetylmuramyl pentapeptide synthase
MRRVIAKILQLQTERLLEKWKPLVIVVTGSVGKTSTTQAIATMLAATRRVRATRHNYNTDVGVPCSVFGHDLPETLLNPFAWIRIVIKNELTLSRNPEFDTLVLELGTDKPGEIADFAYLKPHIAVVTAIAPEHMEFFGTIESVAEEELAVFDFAESVACNEHLVPDKYLGIKDVNWYSVQILDKYKTKPKVLGEQGRQTAAAAVWVAEKVGIGKVATEAGLAKLAPQAGRMQLLRGVCDGILVDDTYNASPEAYIAALDFLYQQKNCVRLLLLGNMNELGASSADEHTRIGMYCDPKKLQVVVTLGPDVNKFAAVAAEKRGCKVVRTQTPSQAADVLRTELKRAKGKKVVLLKGSQNGVFAEEAVKQLLQNKEDASRLVRQSPAWLKKKAKTLRLVG